MRANVVITLLVGLAVLAQASDNSIEVTLEDTPEQQQTPFPGWRFQPGTTIQDSDSEGVQWQFKFTAGSDKRLGTAADSAAINALVPSTTAPVIRWVSRSVVVAAANCPSASSSAIRLQCLFVLEKHRSKWEMTHHYVHRGFGAF